MTRVKSGVVECGKVLPQRFFPLTFEWTLGSLLDDLQEGMSSSFQIEQPWIKLDVLQLDTSVENSFYESLLKGMSLQFQIPNYICQQQPVDVNTSSFSIAIARAMTRMSNVFVTFKTAAGEVVTDMPFPDTAAAGMVGRLPNTDDFSEVKLKDPNFSFSMAIGSRRFPEIPISSVAEFIYHLKIAMNCAHSHTRSLNLDRAEYQTNKFAIGLNTARVPGEPASGISTRTGDLLRLSFDRMSNSSITSCYVHLVGVSVISITEQSVSVFD
jgi:hypothetical protein